MVNLQYYSVYYFFHCVIFNPIYMSVGQKQTACDLPWRQIASVFVILGESISHEANIQEINQVKYVH